MVLFFFIYINIKLLHNFNDIMYGDIDESDFSMEMTHIKNTIHVGNMHIIFDEKNW